MSIHHGILIFPAFINQVDFVNLATFDFTTPERNPHEADYTAP
ncbi:Chitinase-like protein Idgf2 [Lucilia cuprina]|nr:Chitinase-like protein Idgf2 [Lucilia cuprina]